MMASVWLAESVLEVAGSILALRRRNWLLLPLFAFCAASDLAGFFILRYFGHHWLAWAGWGQRAGKYFLLILIACSICGKFVREEDSQIYRMAAAILTLIGSAIVLKFFSDGTILSERLMDAEIAANVFLMLLIGLGWLTQKGKLTAPWNWIAAGFIVQIGSAIVVTALWTVWDGAKCWYPAGTIPAYLLWLRALARQERQLVSRTALPDDDYRIGPECLFSDPDLDWLRDHHIRA